MSQVDGVPLVREGEGEGERVGTRFIVIIREGVIPTLKGQYREFFYFQWMKDEGFTILTTQHDYFCL